MSSSVRIGQSYEGLHGIWEKVSLEADVDEYPESANLELPARKLYVATRLRQQVLVIRLATNGIHPDAFAAEHAHLEQLAQTYVPAA